MVNKVFLIGNVGAEPENRTTEKNACVRLSLATNEVYKNSKGERQEKTEWHKLMAFNSKADYIMKRVKKGMRLYIEGRLHTASWLEGDKWQSVTYINVIDIQILSQGQSVNLEKTGDPNTDVKTLEQ